MSAVPQNNKCKDCEKWSDCFNGINRADMDQLIPGRRDLRFKKGEVICKQGTFASNIMFIYSGFAKTYLETESGKHVILNILAEGQMIGLPALFSHNVFPYSAAAVEDCIICSIDITDFENITSSDGVYAAGIIRIINSCIINNYDRYLSITQPDMKVRLADVFIYLTEKIYKKPVFSLGLTRNDLAEMTHMSPESVTRVLSGFRDEGIIMISGRNCEIKKMEELKKISLSA